MDFLTKDMTLSRRTLLSAIGVLLLVCISCTETKYLTASAKYNKYQRKRMVADVTNCFIQTPRLFSIRMTTMTVFNLMGKHISQCVKSHFIAEDHQNTAVLSRSSTYCGMVTLNTGQLYFPKFIYIKVDQGFVIQLNILSFDFAWTRFGCESHGLSFPHTQTSDGVFFCGKRLPWSMVKTKTEAYTKLSIIPYLQFKANIFYSSYILSWLHHFAHHTYIHSNFLVDTVLQWAPSHYLKTESFIYHIITHPMYNLGFDAMVLDLANSELMFYDGPGILSKLLFVLNRASLKRFKVLNLRTLAFCAFVTFKKSFNSTSVFSVNINPEQQRRVPSCLHHYVPNAIFVKSTSHTICYDKIERMRPNLAIFSFIFIGPGMITGQDTAWNCQYGGLFVKFADTPKVIDMCESRKPMVHLWGKRKFMQILIVFYTGYSEGEAMMEIMPDSIYFCPTNYMDWIILDSSDRPTTYIINSNPDETCLAVISSSQYIDDSHQCKISFVAERGAIGISTLAVRFTKAIYPCVSSNYKSNEPYNLTALSSENWPIGRARYLQQSGRKVDASLKPIHSFDYLHRVNISLPSLCEKDKFLQMVVEIRQAKCGFNFINFNNRAMYYSVFNYTLQLEKACIDVFIRIHPDGYNHFIYTPNIGQAGSGFLIQYIYNTDCPRECRKYHYVVKVLREEEQTIYEYTSPFGLGI